MPTFCRHNRFLERCPICSKTLPGAAAEGRSAAPRGAGSASRPKRGSAAAVTSTRARREGVHVRRELREADDGYRNELVPGLRAGADAQRLAREIAFSSARLDALSSEPPDLYGEVRALAAGDVERASWACLLIAYLSPLQGEQPFAGIRSVLAAGPERGAPDTEQDRLALRALDLDSVPVGPRSSHEPGRGAEVLVAYLQWVRRGGTAAAQGGGAAASGTQAAAFAGDGAWSAERRFARVFERLALPGFSRAGRYELLLLLGRLGLFELRPAALALGGAKGLAGADATTLAAKRVFAIADPLLLERRAAALADAAGVPIEALDLALANWSAPERATLGFPADLLDEPALRRAERALGL